MRAFLWPIVICVGATLLGLAVDGLAIMKYQQGRGGFKLGVDVAGGTILVYEVDVDKFKGKDTDPASGLPYNWNPQELADRLKKRIDPAGLFDITIRPVGLTRVEIILPTGGKHQADSEKEEWETLVKEVSDKDHWPPRYYRVPFGLTARFRLVADIVAQYPDVAVKTVEDFIAQELAQQETKDGKPVTDEEKWKKVLARAEEKWPVKKYVVGPGRYDELALQVKQQYPDQPELKIDNAIKPADAAGKEQRRHLTTEEVQRVKELVAQVGSLEFRILANEGNDGNDGEALNAARDFFAPFVKKANEPEDQKRLREERQKELEDLALAGKSPPPPPAPAGTKSFRTKLGDFNYSWVELSMDYRGEHGLANPRDANGKLLDRNQLELLAADDNNIRNTIAGEKLKDKNGNEVSPTPELKAVALILKELQEKAERRERREYPWLAAARARSKGQPFMTGEGLMYSRIAKNARRAESDRDKQYDYFLLTRDSENADTRVTGDYLSTANAGAEGNVHFKFTPAGGNLFRAFTGKNIGKLMAVDLDGQIQSIATIKSAIGEDGVIEGKFEPEQLSRYVTVLRAGALPGTLKPEPVSENTMGPTLGADTVRAGTLSVGIAFAAILVFMVVYYRFAGLVACVALLSNLILTVAFMVLVQQPFTLPGLAGLVLMLGMAVDANVLIYERLREERDRGASLVLAIRNGYDRALPTIIDTHLSSIFTAIVLYMVGNEQLRGFGVILTAGLLISLFTSLYMTRLMFNVFLAKGWLRKLSMFRLLSRTNIDFMAIRNYWFAATLILTILGAGLFFYHLTRGGLNIDFVGGTAYGGELVEMVEGDELRAKLSECKLPDLSVEQIFVSSPEYSLGTKSKLFTVRTSKQNADEVQIEINNKLGKDLKKVYLQGYKIVPGGKQVELRFVDDPKSQGPAFASRAKVSLILSKVFREQINDLKARSKAVEDEDAPAAKRLETQARNLEDAAQQFVLEGLGEEKDGRFQFILLNFLKELPSEELGKVVTATQTSLAERPQPERLRDSDSQLAQSTQNRALAAIILSWGAILLYLWFRFGNWTFGLATVLCLVHDLFFTLGAIALCHYLYEWAPGVASFLLIRDFKIDLTTVAALLTLVGYSVNDTIVVFDRIREVRGKNPELTPKVINDSVNQTLSRTLLTAFSVWLVVIVLYIWGGEGIHLFAFVMVVGVIVGTYSSIYIASPLLLIFGEGKVRSPVREKVPEAVVGRA